MATPFLAGLLACIKEAVDGVLAQPDGRWQRDVRGCLVASDGVSVKGVVLDDDLAKLCDFLVRAVHVISLVNPDTGHRYGYYWDLARFGVGRDRRSCRRRMSDPERHEQDLGYGIEILLRAGQEWALVESELENVWRRAPSLLSSISAGWTRAVQESDRDQAYVHYIRPVPPYWHRMVYGTVLTDLAPSTLRAKLTFTDEHGGNAIMHLRVHEDDLDVFAKHLGALG